MTLLLALGIISAAVPAKAQNSYQGLASSNGSRSYQLRPTDQVIVKVYGQPDLEAKQRITGEGYITMPLLGKVKISSFTIDQAQTHLESLFVRNELLRSPSVTITVEEYSKRTITVLGRVHQPGEIILDVESERVSISQAIAAAGGFTRLAATSSVKITRRTAQGTMTWEVDVDDMLEGYDSNQNVMVEPGDVIFVPERII